MLVNAKCPNCGANIEVDNDKDAGICKYCGAAFVTEKAINNYNITTDNVAISNSTVIINQTIGNVSDMVKILIERKSAEGTLSGIAFEIIVDGKSCASINDNEVMEIEIDRNKEHRIHCSATCALGQTIESNEINFEKGKASNLLIEVKSGRDEEGAFDSIEISEISSDRADQQAQLDAMNEVMTSAERGRIFAIVLFLGMIVVPLIILLASVLK